MRNLFPRIFFFVMFMILFAFACANGEKKQNSTNVILVTLDTVRADHLGCYGYKNIKTPALDWLAKEGVLFENAITSAPITLPAHASILTGLYPFHTNVRNNGTYMLPDNSVTLATIFKKNGYHTAAFISAAVLTALYNLNQGFDVYNEKLDHHKLTSGEFTERRAASVTKAALEWLTANKNDPFFVWIHYYDPHELYEPPEPFFTEYSQHPYDGEIAYVDSQLSGIIKFIKEEEKAGKRIMLIVVADHGEGLWDHGEPEHGIFLYQETVRVPLIFAFFPKEYKSQRIKEVVRTVDILPTILSYLALPPANNLDGINLRPLIEHSAEWKELYAYSETLIPREDFGWSQLFSMQDSNWKYILAPKPELYDMKTDKAEKKNVFGNAHNAVSEKLKQNLLALPIQIKDNKSIQTPLSPEEIEKLTSLGYASQPRTGTMPLPDPKDQVSLIKLKHKAGILFMKKQYQESISLLLEVLKANSENREALLYLTEAYLAVGNIENAIKYAEKNIQIGDANGVLHYNLGNIYYHSGNIAKAESYYKKSLEINPYFPHALFMLGYLEFQRGKLDNAKEYISKSLGLKSQNANAFYVLGSIEAQDNDLKSAIEHFQKTVEIDPLHLEGWKNLAHAYYVQGEFQRAVDTYQQAAKVQPDADLFLKIASIYFYDLKDNRNALTYYKKVLELAPDHPDKLMINQMIAVIEKQ